jgi:hypothetical protein
LVGSARPMSDSSVGQKRSDNSAKKKSVCTVNPYILVGSALAVVGVVSLVLLRPKQL